MRHSIRNEPTRRKRGACEREREREYVGVWKLKLEIRNFRLPDLGRVPRVFPGNGLGTFSSDCRRRGRGLSSPVPTRLRRVAHSNGSPFASGLARLWSAAIPCRQRATRRSRVGTLPRINTVRDSKSAIPLHRSNIVICLPKTIAFSHANPGSTEILNYNDRFSTPRSARPRGDSATNY